MSARQLVRRRGESEHAGLDAGGPELLRAARAAPRPGRAGRSRGRAPPGTSSTARRAVAGVPCLEHAARARRRSRASGRSRRRPARSRTRRTSASRSRAPRPRPVEREEAAGELLVRRAERAMTTWPTRSSGRKFANTPSATRAASRSIGSRSAASTIGTGARRRRGELEPAVAALAAEHGAQVRDRLLDPRERPLGTGSRSTARRSRSTTRRGRGRSGLR